MNPVTHGCYALSVVTSSGSNSTPMLGVLSDVIEEPANRLLIIVMLLAFNDNFLPSVDKLITTFLWEVFFGEEMVGTIVLLLGCVLMLLWNTVGEILL